MDTSIYKNLDHYKILLSLSYPPYKHHYFINCINYCVTQSSSNKYITK